VACSGCIKIRRGLINRTPARIAAPLARTFLPTSATGADVVRVARTWIGVPFRHQGRDRKGVDCLGVPIVVLADLGIVVPEFEVLTDYPRIAATGDFERRFLHVCTPLPKPEPGCIIMLKWALSLMHVAIYTNTDTLIHVLERHKAVIEHGFRGMWRSRYAQGAYTLPGVRCG